LRHANDTIDENSIVGGIAMTGTADYGWVGVVYSGDVFSPFEDRSTVVEEAKVAVTEFKDVGDGEAGLEADETDRESGEGLEDIAGAGSGGCATTVIDEEVTEEGGATVVFGKIDTGV